MTAATAVTSAAKETKTSMWLAIFSRKLRFLFLGSSITLAPCLRIPKMHADVRIFF